MPPKRNRVPLSCLNCKKRKVRCDKVKPVCGGCLRNGVASSCEFIEPPWAQSDEVQLVSKSNKSPAIDEFKRLKVQNDKVIHNQRKEIDDLKRQLAVLHQLQLSGLQQISPREETSTKLTILAKLYPSDKLIVKDDYTLVARKPIKHLDTYSWINLIKLDPILTTLWFKITNMQKIYHTYKMNLLSKVPKKSYKVNEIDFTYSLGPPAKFDAGKCPVVECDFNFLTDDQFPTPSLTMDSPQSTPRSVSRCPYKPGINDDVENDEYSAKGLKMLKKLQLLWDSTLKLIRGNVKMNYQQLQFLIDFYFTSSDIESKLLSFYLLDIQSIVKRNGDTVYLNLTNGPTEAFSNSHLFEKLKVKGVYICILAIILEESLDVLRHRCKLFPRDKFMETFLAVFPNEALYLGLGNKATNIFPEIQEYLLGSLGSLETTPSVTYIACSVALLDREIETYKKNRNPSVKQDFTNIFKDLLKILLSEEKCFEIWKDPQLIELEGDDCTNNQLLKVHFCRIWCNLIRLANLVFFNFVPITKLSDQLDSLLKALFSKIEEANQLQYHIKFITSLDSVETESLMVTLSAHYLISKVTITLNNGIVKVGKPALTVATLEGMIKQCNTWISDPRLKSLGQIRQFEIISILDYVRYFMTYLILLQGEESQDEGLIQSLIPELFSRHYDHTNYLRKCLYDTKDLPSSQYIFLAITEQLTRFIQYMIGLLMRVQSFENTSPLKALLNQIIRSRASTGDSPSDISISEYVSTNMVDAVEDSVNILNQHSYNDKSKKLHKLWKFYLTFAKNSGKMNVTNYAKIHSNIPEFRGDLTGIKSCPVVSDMKGCPVVHSNKGCPVDTKVCPVGPNAKICPVDKGGSMLVGSMTVGSTKQLENERRLSKCPISLITTPMDGDLSSPSPREGSLDSDVSVRSGLGDKKRKCPFDHKSLINGNLRQNISLTESNIRGEHANRMRYSPKPTIPNLSPPKSYPPIASKPVELQVKPERKEEFPKPEGFPALEGFDAQAFGDFDFDFLQNEIFFDQLDLSTEFNNNSIEEYFQ